MNHSFEKLSDMELKEAYKLIMQVQYFEDKYVYSRRCSHLSTADLTDDIKEELGRRVLHE